MMFFYKSGSHTHVTLVGTVACSRSLAAKGAAFTQIGVEIVESFKAKDGSVKESTSVIPVFVEGEKSFETGAVVCVSGDLSICMVAPKSEAQKFDLCQEAVRNADVHVLADFGREGIQGMNQAFLLGRVGSVRAVKSASSSGCALSLAVSRSQKTEDKIEPVTDWHEVAFWGRRAESLTKLAVGKGDILLVRGRLTTRTVKVADRDRSLLTFMAEDFSLVSRKTPAPSAQAAPLPVDSISDAEVPFF